MFKDFGRRLQRDVKHIVDGRIANSETASGSHMRVSIMHLHCWQHRLICAYTPLVEWCRGQCHLAQETAIRCLVWRKSDGFIARVLQRCSYKGSVRGIRTQLGQKILGIRERFVNGIRDLEKDGKTYLSLEGGCIALEIVCDGYTSGMIADADR
jgi:hypothetical protein